MRPFWIQALQAAGKEEPESAPPNAPPPSPPPPPPLSSGPADEEPQYKSYLRPTGERRRRCFVYEKNPDWDGVLKNRASARERDPETSVEAADSIPEGDVHEARGYIDAILAREGTIISVEYEEYVLEGLAAGRIDNHGLPNHVRAGSLRRRFSDFCPERE